MDTVHCQEIQEKTLSGMHSSDFSSKVDQAYVLRMILSNNSHTRKTSWSITH